MTATKKRSQMLRNLLFTLLIFFTTSISYADEAADKLTQLLKNMHSMQADFTQTILDKNGQAVQKSTGEMSLQRPSQFRWDVKKPTKQLVVTNGKKLWIYDPDLEQVTIRSLVKTAGETPAMLLSDEDLAVGDEFSVRETNHSTELKWFVLIPKDKSTAISALKLGFANQEIRQMKLEDHLGHTTLIEFNHVRTNIPLTASTFSFTPPGHIDVIDETKSKR